MGKEERAAKRQAGIERREAKLAEMQQFQKDLKAAPEIAAGLEPGTIDALAKAKLAHRMGVRRELRELPGILLTGEQVVNMAAGQYEGRQGLVVVTEQRVIFFEAGMARSRQEDFHYSRISSVQTKTSMMLGSLIVTVSGSRAEITHIGPKERVGEIAAYVREHIGGGAAPATAPTPATTPPQERMRRLQAMRDEGMLSAEEFEAKRIAILDEL